MNCKRYITLILLLLFFCLHGEQKESIEKLISRLKDGDDSVIPSLVEKQKETLELLTISSDNEVLMLLRNLGALKYNRRLEATKALIKMGPGIHPQVRAFMEENSFDPEIKMRCKEILSHDHAKDNKKVIQIVKLLIEFEDIKKDTVSKFLPSYLEYLKYIIKENHNIDSDDKYKRFIKQIILTEEGDKAVKDWLNKAVYQYRKPIIEAYFEMDPQKAYDDFMNRKNYSILMPLVLKNHKDVLKKIDKNETVRQLMEWGDTNYLGQILDLINKEQGSEIKPGEYDDLFVTLVSSKKHRWNALCNAEKLKVSPKLLFKHLKEQEASDIYFKHYIDGCLGSIITTENEELKKEVIDYILTLLEKDKDLDLNRVKFLQFVIDNSPELKKDMLLAKLDWFFIKPEDKGTVIYYCMFLSAGSHGDHFTDLNAFFLKNSDAGVELIKEKNPEDKDFIKILPLVCVYTFNEKLRNENKDLFKKRIEQFLPNLIGKDRNHLICSIIAATALDVKSEAFEKAVIDLYTDKPAFWSHMESTAYFLGPKHEYMIPNLLGKIEDAKSKYMLKAAVMIGPDNNEVQKYLKKTFLESKDRKIVTESISLLDYIGNFPRLSEIPKDRLKWIMDTHKDNISDTFESMCGNITDKDDQKKLMKLILPDLEKISTFQTYDPGISDLTWKNPESQEVIMEKIIEGLESGNDTSRKFMARLLASSSEKAEGYIDRIHKCLQKESKDEIKESLLWAISNIGTTAWEMQPTVEKLRNKQVDDSLFCLSNICKDPNDRRKYLLELIDEYKNEKSDGSIRQIGLVKNQLDVQVPFLKEQLDIFIHGKKGVQKKNISNYDGQEIMWAFGRQEPSNDLFQLYFDTLKECSKDIPTVNEDFVEALLWCIRFHYPERLEECRELIENLPLRLRGTFSYRITLRQLNKKADK